MATIDWPNTLPNPSASNFKCGTMNYGPALQFQSGRSRIFRNRATKYELGTGYNFEQILTMELSFQFTLSEYSVFISFYTTYWKTFANRCSNVLRFTFPGGVYLSGWVPGDISTKRNENSWNVSFSVQCDWFAANVGSDPDNQHPIAPKLPDQFKMSNGAKIERISRDITIRDDRFNLHRSVGPVEKFVSVLVEWQMFDFSDVALLFGWYAISTNFGVKPFKVPVSNFDIGAIGGVVPTWGYYGCKFLGSPKVSFRGAFGSASVELLAFVPIDSAFFAWTNAEVLKFDDASADLIILDSSQILVQDVEIYESQGEPTWVP